MSAASQLVIEGQVRRPCSLSHDDLLGLAAETQVEDVRELGAKRPGRAVRLSAVLGAAEPLETATYLGLHASADDFHASIPLAPVLERAVIIYSAAGQPLSVSAGGPFRLFIPDHAACHVSEIDECANVKFIDRIELTEGKGYDNRPEDDEAHRALHEGQG
jgi:DMSO/TMAO reductase YedYZ molybdopterin-dependent catalytic subunit